MRKKSSNPSGGTRYWFSARPQMLLQLTIANENSIRGTTTSDGKQRFSVFDFLTILCNDQLDDTDKKKAVGNAHKWFARLIAEGAEHRDEIISNVVYLKFPGPRQRDTPTMTLAGLQKLLLLLGGKVAGKFRELLSDTFRRVEAGDHT